MRASQGPYFSRMPTAVRIRRGHPLGPAELGGRDAVTTGKSVRSSVSLPEGLPLLRDEPEAFAERCKGGGLSLDEPTLGCSELPRHLGG
jgi:hypothetical protein